MADGLAVNCSIFGALEVSSCVQLMARTVCLGITALSQPLHMAIFQVAVVAPLYPFFTGIKTGASVPYRSHKCLELFH